jgi:Cu-processing system permease protein
LRQSNALLAVARKELTDGLQNRWIWMVAVLLGGSVLAIAFFGGVPVGVAGAQGGGLLLVSLMNIAVYLVPLLAVVLGCGVIIDEKQRGTLDLILISPVSPARYFWGLFLGYTAALTVAILLGFGLAGIVVGMWVDIDAGSYALLCVLALILGMVFLAISFLVSILARDRGRAVVSSVFVWICSVLVFDLLVLGLLVVTEGGLPAGVFTALLLLNPTDVFRVLCFTWVELAAGPLGLGTVQPILPSAVLAGGALFLWVCVPLGLGYGFFRRRLNRDALL